MIQTVWINTVSLTERFGMGYMVSLCRGGVILEIMSGYEADRIERLAWCDVGMAFRVSMLSLVFLWLGFLTLIFFCRLRSNKKPMYASI